MTFSVCFGANALAIVFSAALSVRFRHPELVLYRGSQGMLAVSILLLAAMGSSCSFWIYETLLLCLLVMLGLTFTSSNTLAMNAERQHAGTASAVLGALGFAFGGIVSPLVGIGDIMLSTGIVFTASSLGAFTCARIPMRRLIRRKVAVACGK